MIEWLVVFTIILIVVDVWQNTGRKTHLFYSWVLLWWLVIPWMFYISFWLRRTRKVNRNVWEMELKGCDHAHLIEKLPNKKHQRLFLNYRFHKFFGLVVR